MGSNVYDLQRIMSCKIYNPHRDKPLCHSIEQTITRKTFPFSTLSSPAALARSVIYLWQNDTRGETRRSRMSSWNNTGRGRVSGILPEGASMDQQELLETGFGTSQSAEGPLVLGDQQIGASLHPRLAWMMYFEETRSVQAVADKFGISRKTFYKWYKRYKDSNSRQSQRPIPPTAPLPAGNTRGKHSTPQDGEARDRLWPTPAPRLS